VPFTRCYLNYLRRTMRRERTEPTLEEKRQLMKQDRILSLNGLDRDQLLPLTRILAAELLDRVEDETVERDWDALYQDVWLAGLREIHRD
jgi:hypothetical protein